MGTRAGKGSADAIVDAAIMASRPIRADEEVTCSADISKTWKIVGYKRTDDYNWTYTMSAWDFRNLRRGEKIVTSLRVMPDDRLSVLFVKLAEP